MNKKRRIMAFLLVFCLVLLSYNALYAEEIDSEPEKVNDKYIEWLQLPDEEREDTIAPPIYVKNIEYTEPTTPTRIYNQNLGATYTYNLRDSIPGLKIKNQEQTEQCWAFAITTQLESYMAKIKNKQVEYSPRHIEYATSKTFLNNVINENGYNREVNSGGNFVIAYGYLTSGKGPVLESDMPFVNTSEKIDISEIQNKKVQAQLKEYRLFPSIYKEKSGNRIVYSNGQTGQDRVEYTEAQVTNVRNEIKNHIMKYGSVVSMTAIRYKQYFSNQSNYIASEAYYCNNENIKADHAVSIIGWDDNYSASNFNPNNRPSTNGAWIIQNSYGTEISDNLGNKYSVFKDGLLYISYEDFLIECSVFGAKEVDNIKYDNIYQYDELGTCAFIPVNSSGPYIANVFTKEKTNEYISEIGVSTVYTSSNYSYEVYINSASGDLDISNFQKVKTLSNTSSSYVTVTLDTPIKITGDKFAVAVKYISGTTSTDMPIEARTSMTNAWATSKANPRRNICII